MLQSPITYILALIAAFLAYYVDAKYDLGLIYRRSVDHIGDLAESLKPQDEAQDSIVQPVHAFAISFLILSLVLALKKVLHKRKGASKS